MSAPTEPLPDDELIRRTRFTGYLRAHSGNGWSGFFRSNLFTALVIWLLGQVLIVSGTFIAAARVYGRYEQKLEDWSQWKTETSAAVKQMNDHGTNSSHSEIARQEKDIGELDGRLKAVEARISHEEVQDDRISVLRRDVDDLRTSHPTPKR